MMSGSLHLFPCPISETDGQWFSDSHITSLKKCRHFIVERARTTRRWLSKIGFPVAISELEILEMNKRYPAEQVSITMDWLKQGHQVALLSESGTPCIADPGNVYVDAAHDHGYKVIPYVGPNSIMLALMASGLNGQNFCFHGYLPIKEGALKDKLRQLSASVKKEKQTQIWIETPYRNDRMLNYLQQCVDQNVKLCIASELLSPEQFILTRTIREWNTHLHVIGKKNTIFLIG